MTRSVMVKTLGIGFTVLVATILVSIAGHLTAGKANAQGGNPTLQAIQELRRDIRNGVNVNPRRYYLSQVAVDGANALAACAPRFHMASLWEILDPSHLRYDTTRGRTRPDAGEGPPANDDDLGWIRTGENSGSVGGGTDPENTLAIGRVNCDAWTTNDPAAIGSAVILGHARWTEIHPTTYISPWVGAANSCATANPVWCVED
jgi:hypothetical protein